MYKLYYAEGSASMGVRVLLEEIGVDYAQGYQISKPVELKQLVL